MSVRKVIAATLQDALRKRNARWWAIVRHDRGMEEDYTHEILDSPIQAYTKSEARAILKGKLGVTRFPARVTLEEIILEDVTPGDAKAGRDGPTGQ